MDKQKDTVDICNNILDVIDCFYSKIDDAAENCVLYTIEMMRIVSAVLCAIWIHGLLVRQMSY